jgi:hypothetical protein
MRNPFIIGLLCTCCAPLWAQDSIAMIKKDTTELRPIQIEESQLEHFRNNPDFDYEEAISVAPDWWITFKNWIASIFIKFFEWLFGVEKAAGAFGTFLHLVPYVLLAVFLFILIKFFIGVNTRAVLHAKKSQAIVALSEEEHIIKNEDIQQLIENAIGQKDYRLAVRYYYLYILQLMSEKELIVWELQKTNEDYKLELQKQELVEPFATSTRLYNYFWYGEFPIDKTKYKKAEANFLSLKKLLMNG